MKAMTLRIEDSDAERLRQEAFDQRISQTDIVRHALHVYLLRGEPNTRVRSDCDAIDCTSPSVMTTTPGGFRFCGRHAPEEARA